MMVGVPHGTHAEGPVVVGPGDDQPKKKNRWVEEMIVLYLTSALLNS